MQEPNDCGNGRRVRERKVGRWQTGCVQVGSVVGRRCGVARNRLDVSGCRKMRWVRDGEMRKERRKRRSSIQSAW